MISERIQLVIDQQTKEIERLRNQLSDLCPIADFDVITSLRVEKKHMAEEIANQKAIAELAVKALERIAKENLLTLPEVSWKITAANALEEIQRISTEGVSQ